MAQVSVTFDCPDHDPSQGMQAIDWQAQLNKLAPFIIQMLLALFGNPPMGQQQPGGRQKQKP